MVEEFGDSTMTSIKRKLSGIHTRGNYFAISPHIDMVSDGNLYYVSWPKSLNTVAYLHCIQCKTKYTFVCRMSLVEEWKSLRKLCKS